ncbi:MAG: HAD hydrolase family protein [bacterium]|nr:HAD hydrolase family protein [bacterium]
MQLPFINDNRFTEKLKQIDWIVTDMDGVWTDGKFILDGQQNESKFFSARDGIGIYLAHQANMKTAILTGRISNVVKRRARELQITKVIGRPVNQKADGMRELIHKCQLQSNQILYIGDDIIDIPVFQLVDVSVVPFDADEFTKTFAKAQTYAKGGEGVIREVVTAILKAKNLYEKILKEKFQIHL